MKARKYLPVILIIIGLVIFAGNTSKTYSQVAFGVRYQSGPVTFAFGNAGSYRPVYYYPVRHYYPVKHYNYWPRRHYRHYYYYGHDRGRHRGWYRYRHHRRQMLSRKAGLRLAQEVRNIEIRTLLSGLEEGFFIYLVLLIMNQTHPDI